jgi:hypothetical protein
VHHEGESSICVWSAQISFAGARTSWRASLTAWFPSSAHSRRHLRARRVPQGLGVGSRDQRPAQAMKGLVAWPAQQLPQTVDQAAPETDPRLQHRQDSRRRLVQ